MGLFGFMVVFLVIMIVLFIRIEVQYRFATRSINIIYDQENWYELRMIHLERQYTIWEILNPLLWTFDQIYPGLSELEVKDD